MPMMFSLLVIMACFAVYRLSRLIVFDEGPFDLFLKFRELVGVYDRDVNGRAKTSIGRLFACPYCIGLWISIVIVYFLFYPVPASNFLIFVFGIAGVQSFIQRIGEFE